MNTSVVFGCISLANAYTTRRLLGGIVMFDFIYKATQIQSLLIYKLDFYIPAPIQVCNREQTSEMSIDIIALTPLI